MNETSPHAVIFLVLYISSDIKLSSFFNLVGDFSFYGLRHVSPEHVFDVVVGRTASARKFPANTIVKGACWVKELGLVCHKLESEVPC